MPPPRACLKSRALGRTHKTTFRTAFSARWEINTLLILNTHPILVVTSWSEVRRLGRAGAAARQLAHADEAPEAELLRDDVQYRRDEILQPQKIEKTEAEEQQELAGGLLLLKALFLFFVNLRLRRRLLPAGSETAWRTRRGEAVGRTHESRRRRGADA